MPYYPNSLYSIAGSSSLKRYPYYNRPCDIHYCELCEKEIGPAIKQYESLTIPVF